MVKRESKRYGNRIIHIRLSEEVHKRLRIRAAVLDTTMQDWVAETIAKELDRQEKRKRSRI